MAVSETQEQILSLLFDGYSLAEIIDVMMMTRDQVIEEMAAAFEAIRVSTLEEAKDMIETYGAEMLSATRH